MINSIKVITLVSQLVSKSKVTLILLFVNEVVSLKLMELFGGVCAWSDSKEYTNTLGSGGGGFPFPLFTPLSSPHPATSAIATTIIKNIATAFALFLCVTLKEFFMVVQFCYTKIKFFYTFFNAKIAKYCNSCMYIIDISHSRFAILLIYCIFIHYSLIYIHENNRNGQQSENCYFSYNSNKLRQDVPLRERGSEFCDSFIVLAFFNGVNMKHSTNKVACDLTLINPDTQSNHTVIAINHVNSETGKPELFLNSTSPESGVFITERQAIALQKRIRDFLVLCDERRCANV